jgi:hypothetical protein
VRQGRARASRAATGRRDGFALGAAVLATVVIGALIACAAAVAMQDYYVGRNLLVEQRAFAVAEAGVNGVLAHWGAGAAPLPARGDVLTHTLSNASGDRAVVRLMRTTDSTFWAVSEGTASPGDARLRSTRRTNLVLRLGADGALRPATGRSWAQLF